MKQTITAVIPAKNEQDNIERCIKSVLWCDKIIVLWMGRDKTGHIAKKLGAEVIVKHSSETSDFEAVQENINYAIDHCKTDWILRIDADEVVTEELKEEIQNLLNAKLQTEKIVAYRIPRKHFLMGSFLKGGDWSYDKLVRLFKPSCARYDPIVQVHEQLNIKGEIGVLKSSLLHYSHPTIEIALKKFNTYTDVEIKDMKESLPKAFFDFVVQPPYIFARWMIWHKGYRDGARGLVGAALRSWYAYLLYGKYIQYKLKT
jgi:glycosyltransferase involved in cell wall biosynthesis